MDDSTKTTILVVDDYSMNLKMAEFMLKDKFNVKCAISGADAIKILEKENINCIILDVMMPDMDGFETYEKIRQLEACKNIPVCFATANSDEYTINKIRNLNCEYINKPLNPSETTSLLEKLV